MQRRVKNGLCEIDSVDSANVEEARAALPRQTVLQQVAEALKVLAHPNRLRVLEALDGRELFPAALRSVRRQGKDKSSLVTHSTAGTTFGACPDLGPEQ